MKFLVAYVKGDYKGVKFELDNGEQVWGKCSQKVIDFAKKNFKENEECIIEFTEEDGGYKVGRVVKKGAGVSSPKSSPPPEETTKSSGTPTCADCGIELKDDKYEKCYPCNQKNPSKSARGGKTPEDRESIIRQSVMKATCSAIPALAGQVDVNSLGDIIITLYKKLYKEITG